MGCRLALFEQPSGGQQPFGEAGEDEIESGTGSRLTIPMTGSFDVTPGTYNVVVQCTAFNVPANQIQYRKGNLSVIASAR